MNRYRFVAVATALLVCPLLLAQDAEGGWGLGSPYNRRYDPLSEVSFSGRVIGLHRMSPLKGMSEGVMVLVRTPNGGTALVELGPAWYFEKQPIKIALRDRVQVSGSKVFEGTKSSILARKIVVANRVAYLRGVDGFPIWVPSRGHVDVKGSPPPR